jgi:glutamate racemase
MMVVRMKIGVFDSGLGGLTILRAVRSALPEYEYLFYGDTLHVPYGDRGEEEIYTLTKAAVTELFERGCVLVVIACNTASAETLRRLQDTFLPEAYPDRRILGVVIPTIEELIQSGTRHALLIATTRTVDSRKYDIELQKRNITHLTLTSHAMPELVPLIEAGNFNDAAAAAVRTIEGEGGIDTVILGCTHYVTLKDALRSRFKDSGIAVISQDEVIPRKLTQYLMNHPEIESRLGRGGEMEVVLTKDTPEYRALCARLLTT